MMSVKMHNPWKGLTSYEVDDPCLFCGREQETAQLVSLIEYNQILTLYGKSGCGKSSILKAGVFPALKEEGFTPYYLRLGELSTVQPYATQIAHKLGLAGDVIEDWSSKDALCLLFSQYEYAQNLSNTAPIIVLDQFEEVLRAHTAQCEILLEQLAFWQDYNREILIDSHFVLSIREDNLYLLEELIDKTRLNSLRRARYRLRDVDREGATSIITTPGKGIVLQQSVVEKILELCAIRNDNMVLGYSVSGLSLLCFQLFYAMRQRNMSVFSSDLVEKHSVSSIRDYYQLAIKRMQLSSKEIKYLEEKFVTNDGNRNFISESDFQTYFSEQSRKCLLGGEYRMLQKSNGRVELIHDLLAKAIKQVRDEAVHAADAAKLMYETVLISIALIGMLVFTYWSMIGVTLKDCLTYFVLSDSPLSFSTVCGAALLTLNVPLLAMCLVAIIKRVHAAFYASLISALLVGCSYMLVKEVDYYQVVLIAHSALSFFCVIISTIFFILKTKNSLQ